MSTGESTSREYTHQLFVSYATEDVELVEPLVKRLQEEHYTVWFDRHDLRATETIPSNIDRAVRQCRQMLICLSDHCDAEWAQYELNLNHRMDPANSRSRSIPALIRPMTKPVQAQVCTISCVDLNKERYEGEFRCLKESIPPSSTPYPPIIVTPVPPRTAFWLLTQLPLAGVATLQWSCVEEHSILAVLVGLAYEAFIFVAPPLMKAWWGLEPDFVECLRRLLHDGFLKLHDGFLNLFSRYRGRYLYQVRKEHGTLGSPGASALSIARSYVEHRLVLKRAEEVASDHFSSPATSGALPVRDLLPMLEHEEAHALVIIGPTGSGKSTSSWPVFTVSCPRGKVSASCASGRTREK